MVGLKPWKTANHKHESMAVVRGHNPGQKSLGHPAKTVMQNCKFVKKTLRKSVALFM